MHSKSKSKDEFPARIAQYMTARGSLTAESSSAEQCRAVAVGWKKSVTLKMVTSRVVGRSNGMPCTSLRDATAIQEQDEGGSTGMAVFLACER
jgi:cation transport regulator ChaC